MRVINLGLRTTQDAVLTAKLPATDATAVLRIGNGVSFSSVGFHTESVQLPLPIGDYVITVDSALRPAPGSPFEISTNLPAVYMTAGELQNGVRTLVVGTGFRIDEEDPKDPWPTALASTGSTAESTFLASSPILPAMRAMVDAYPVQKGGWSGDERPSIHALLIGIDDYAPGLGKEGVICRPLRGCVQDILDAEQYLRDIGVPVANIERLIAPQDGGPSAALRPPAEALPTYGNIVSAWQRVTARAARGDILYIHYSGHGGRSATEFPSFKSNGLDESIAPCDINLPKGRYLRDVEIAVLLKQMAQRGLLTTLVLDCCYSGSATRGSEARSRRGDRDDLASRAGQSADNSAVASRTELEAMAKHLASTARRDDQPWRIVAGGPSTSLTTVIAACRPHESSYEYAVDGKTYRGALSYFWLETLRQRSPRMTYRRAYQETFAKVQGVFKEQSPVLLGAPDRLVLGAATLARPASIGILEVKGEEVTIAAGASGLLSVGTRLAVLPGDALPELSPLSRMRQIEVVSVLATTSCARIVAEQGEDQPPITLGSQAVITAHAPTTRRAVRWLPAAQSSPEELAARNELEREIAADSTHLIGLADGARAHYQVTLEDSRLVILDPAGSPLPHLPRLRAAEPNAARALKERLVHLARFHNVLGLTNNDPSSPLTGKLELSLHISEGNKPARVALPVAPRLPCNAELYLKISNRSTRHLSIAIFDLAPDWGIEYVNQRCPLTVDSGTSVDVKLTTSLPAGYELATDVLKVIGTVEHTDLEWLSLRPLDQPYTSKRSTQTPKTAFEELLAAMHEPSRAARHVEMAASPTIGWCEAQLCLRVRR